ncbi:MAG: NAD-dependent epimerase/dehydratase family protein [Pirellulales bacterium]
MSDSGTKLVVGCGYLGLRVARLWRNAGARVCAVTRSADRARALAAEGLDPLVGDVTAPEGLPALPAVDTLFWAVGFDRASGASYRDVHVGGLGRVLDAIPDTARVVFASSTGVWGTDDGGIVDETTPAHPAREAGRVLLEAEDLLHAKVGDRGTALRFAGLYGPGRLPRLDDLKAGRPIAADPDSWLNLVHVDDAARIVVAVAAAPHARRLYVVSDGHPVRRRDWYAHLAARTGSPPPSFDTAAERTRGADKRVDPALLFRDIPLALAYPDSFRGIDAIV